MKNKVKIYYSTWKPGGADDPNYRVYFISNYHGNPFISFMLPGDFEQEKSVVCNHIGLQLKHVDFVKRGPQK